MTHIWLDVLNRPELERAFTEKNSGLDWSIERSAAAIAISNDSRLEEAASMAPTSLQVAMVTVANIGLSLSGSRNLCFLTTYNGKVAWDIGYQGIIVLATRSGTVQKIAAVPVYATDTFESKGPFAEPIHIYDSFLTRKHRGELKLIYVITHIKNAGVQVLEVPAEDIYQIRDKEQERNLWLRHFMARRISRWIFH